VNAVELGPVPDDQRTQSPTDLFLIFAGANIVATTIVTGASLPPGLAVPHALGLVAAGSVAGAALVAALVPAGARLGVPSVVAARAALGRSGAALLAAILYVTNFAWIALNNVIAASACGQLWGGRASERAWAVGLGLLATAVVAAGPGAVGWADRVAVPLMSLMATLLIATLVRHPVTLSGPGAPAADWLRGFDLVVGYQLSWLLMFADYPRYTRDGRRGAAAVFLALALTSLAFMAIGVLGARAAGSTDPADMVAALGWGPLGAPLLTLATLTTNFVNIYMSALAWKSLRPATSGAGSVWVIGGIGAVLALLSRAWLDRYADFMLLLGALLVPVGGLLVARFVLSRAPVAASALYTDETPRWSIPALLAWTAGAGAYFLPAPWGGTLASLAVTIAAYAIASRLARSPPTRQLDRGPDSM
jgi:purine-cytosine permease-like protein